ncbi:MAG: zf-HC2 domain-containing protein, partial [Pseudomonadales bacterium]
MTTALTDQDFILLSAYIDGELAPTESRKLEDRIANFPVLTRQFNIMAGQSIVLRNQSERLLPDALYPELSKNIEDILDNKPIPSRVRTYT